MASSNLVLPRAYGGVCLLVSSISFNYLVSRDIEKNQRAYYFDEDPAGKQMHERNFEEIHRKEVGDSLAAKGLPDDGNSIYTLPKGYATWYL